MDDKPDMTEHDDDCGRTINFVVFLLRPQQIRLPAMATAATPKGKAVLIGATGAIGSCLFGELLRSKVGRAQLQL